MEVDGQGSSTEYGRSSAPCLLQIPNTGSRDVTGQLEAERSRAIVNVIGEVAFLYAGCIAHVAGRPLLYKRGAPGLRCVRDQLKNWLAVSNSDFGANGFPMKKIPFFGSTVSAGAGSPETKISGMAGQSDRSEAARSVSVMRGIRMSVITKTILLLQA